MTTRLKLLQLSNKIANEIRIKEKKKKQGKILYEKLIAIIKTCNYFIIYYTKIKITTLYNPILKKSNICEYKYIKAKKKKKK